VRFVVISDTHNRVENGAMTNPIPDGDVLLHCGDMTDVGKRDQIMRANEWLGK
jgi:predicted phosphodiesterase